LEDFDKDKDLLRFTGGEIVCRVLLIILQLYFGIYEMIQLFGKGLTYFLDFWNVFDCASFILNTLLVVNHLGEFELFEKNTIVVLCFVSMTIMWMKLFQWFRLFDSTSFYMRLIQETLWSIRYFFLIYVVTNLMFANATYILNHTRTDENQINTRAFNNQISDAILSQYMVSLGDFSIAANFNDGEFGVLLWIILLLGSFISMLTILNMLIAIMGDTFDAVSERSVQASLREKINILNDFVWVVGLSSSASNDRKFFFAATPLEVGDDDGAWEGKVGAIKSALTEGLNE